MKFTLTAFCHDRGEFDDLYCSATGVEVFFFDSTIKACTCYIVASTATVSAKGKRSQISKLGLLLTFASLLLTFASKDIHDNQQGKCIECYYFILTLTGIIL
jgi:hypothetical protein